MFKLIFYWLGWSLGWVGRPPATSSGFSGDHLVATRERNPLEAFIRIVSTGLFFAAICGHFIDSLAPLMKQDAYWFALPAMLWAYQTIFRPETPMDSAAISTGLWCFGPYLPFFLIMNIARTPLYSLMAQMGGFVALLTYGLVRDIRKESKDENSPQ